MYFPNIDLYLIKKTEKKTCRFVYKNYEYIDDETKYIQIDINKKKKKIYNRLLRKKRENEEQHCRRKEKALQNNSSKKKRKMFANR
jgi:hypothetical protein